MRTFVGRRQGAATMTGIRSPDRDFRLNRKPSPGSIVHYSWRIRSQTTIR